MRVDVRTVGLFEENCYLVVDETTRRAVLVDPGDDPDDILAMVCRSGATLDAIWLTHAHLDHIGAINAVRHAHPVPVFLHPGDLPYYERLSSERAALYEVPWDQPGVSPSPIDDLQSMSCGSLAFRVLHVPGHAAGHVLYYGEGVVFSGDLFSPTSVSGTELPLSDTGALRRSIARFATLPSDTVVYPGHGSVTTAADALAQYRALASACDQR